ncbi:helix-turn-helix domain-containing protein [Arachidicoccus soli]|uniref:AraC family transcriptional regulator n=1 Tax=Arachidicoccus soli TaxID=2341117 RepID=A0A386HNG2_9BACT|nr:AraC family transcriptional regulator [Arachidicoccus soli]AYD47202.1 AraC family transcriptional regulator [Arachidicoccus soli]
MLSLKIKNWLNQFKKYYFTYKKGFYHLPYNGCSPQSLIESFDSFPFVQHSKEKHCISSNNPLCEGGFYYQQIEDGCWIVYAKMRYKANVAYDLIFKGKEEDKEITDEDYYMLSLNNINNSVNLSKDICEKAVVFPNYSWTFFKPKVRNCDLNFKGASNKYITIYFNETWLQKNLMPNKIFTESGLTSFIKNQDTKYIIWSLQGNETIINNFDTFDKAMNIGGDAREIDILNLKYCTIHLIFDFLRSCKEQNIIGQYNALEYNDRFSINRVENYLKNHLFDKFPGIDILAKKFAISETKLKVEFKQVYGKPIYQYFRDAKMELAKELITENQLIIKEISFKLGYENASKFSIAFKKHHGILPSELRKS